MIYNSSFVKINNFIAIAPKIIVATIPTPVKANPMATNKRKIPKILYHINWAHSDTDELPVGFGGVTGILICGLGIVLLFWSDSTTVLSTFVSTDVFYRIIILVNQGFFKIFILNITKFITEFLTVIKSIF